MELLDGRFELKETAKLEGHTDRVWSLAWNPATGVGGIPLVFASCSGDKTVRIWEESPSSGSWNCKAVLEETHTRTVRSCAWSPNGKLLATASFDATTAIWENIGGDYECVSTLEGHENEIKSVAWNASGSLLATCSRDRTVWIWEVLPGNEYECVSVLQGHTQDVKMVQWHPTMDLLFSCSYDNTVKVWAGDDDNDDWHCVQTLDESNKRHTCTLSGYHDRTIFSVHWSRNGIIASGAADDAIRLFVENQEKGIDRSSFQLIFKKEKAHNMDVNSVQWSPGEKGLLASASDDGTIRIWELVPIS
uniref:Probable cytosolic iron-sulfur protein assembly protein CIAO1 homolog n=1 Tax=Cucumis melo TaxID=3656 RepID=A0A9I9CWM7_CUCME